MKKKGNFSKRAALSKKPKYKARSSRFSFYSRLAKPHRVRRNRNKYTPHTGKKQLAKARLMKECVSNDLKSNL